MLFVPLADKLPASVQPVPKIHLQIQPALPLYLSI
jgi:hypothetical protein